MKIRIVALALLYFLLIVNNIDHSSQNQRGEFSTWFHVNAGVFKIKHVLPLNMSSNTNITMDVAIPETNEFQKLLDISSEPNPNSTFIDADNLPRLRYELATVFPKFLNITIYYTIRIVFSSLMRNISGSSNIGSTQADVLTEYTNPAPYIESDNPILIGNATAITENTTDIDYKVTKLFDFVSNDTLFEYDDDVQKIVRNCDSHTRGALWALQNGKGVCFDFAHLFVALLRAIDIPSRVSEGIILDGRAGFIVHDWVEVYFADVGWVPYDPTWDEEKCNIHVKMLNPSYDQSVRWNYSISSGQLFNFPENSTYAINDDISIENVTNPDIVDLFFQSGDSNLNLTRMFHLNNETIASSFCMTDRSNSVRNNYGHLKVKLAKNNLGFRIINYRSEFFFQQPKSVQLEITIPYNLIFSETITPSLGMLEYYYTVGEVDFVLIKPILWIGIAFGIIGFLIILMFLTLRKKLVLKDDLKLAIMIGLVLGTCIGVFLLPIELQNLLKVRHSMFEPLAYITASFVHGDPQHLVSNLVVFVFFSLSLYYINKKAGRSWFFLRSLLMILIVLPLFSYSLLYFSGIFKSVEHGFGLSLVDSALIGFTIPSLICFFKYSLSVFRPPVFFMSVSLFTFCLVLLPYAAFPLFLLSISFAIVGCIIGVFEFSKILKLLVQWLKQRATFLISYVIILVLLFYFVSVASLFPSNIISHGGLTDIASHYIGLVFGIFPFSLYVLQKSKK